MYFKKVNYSEMLTVVIFRAAGFQMILIFFGLAMFSKLGVL